MIATIFHSLRPVFPQLRIEAAEELLDLVNYPYEMKNVVSDRSSKKVLEMMRDYYDQEIEKWKQEAVAMGQYQEFGTLFDRHISWDDKKELIPKSFWKGYSNPLERIAYEGDPGDYQEVVNHAEK